MHADAGEKCKKQDITRAKLENPMRNEIKESQRVCEKLKKPHPACEQASCLSVIQGAARVKASEPFLGKIRIAVDRSASIAQLPLCHNAINGVTCPAPVNQPALGSFDNPAVSTLTSAVQGPPNRSSQYASATPYAAVPAISNVYSTLSTDSINLSTVDGLTTLANMIATAAGPNVYPNGTVPTNLGTSSSPVVNVVNGDLTIGGSGAGVLLVTGTLTLHGNFSWDGLILAIGEGAIVKDGGGSATLNGSMFAANLTMGNPLTIGPAAYPGGGLYPTLIALGANNPPGKPFFGWNGGGSATVQYDSCWTQTVNKSLPYHIVAQRELSY